MEKKKKFLLIGGLFLLTIIIFCYLLCVLLNSFLFKVKKIEIAPFNHILSEHIKKRIANRNIFKLDINALRKEVLRKFYTEIEDVHFFKEFPNSIRVKFEPREFNFQFFYKGKWYILDKDFRVKKRLKYPPHPQLIIIEGLDLQNKDKVNVLKELCKDLRDFKFIKKIKSVQIYNLVNLKFKMNSGLKVIIGYKDLKNRLKLLKKILNRIKEKDLDYIDLRFAKPVIKFKKC